MTEEPDAAEQERRDKRWKLLNERAPAGSGPVGLLGGVLLPSSEHTLIESRRQRDSGATLAVGGKVLDLDLDKGTVVIRTKASGPEGEGDSAEG